MQFIIKNLSKSINDLMRTIGYRAAYFQKEGEFSIVRQIGRNDYPRFHVYMKPLAEAQEGPGKGYSFNLHVDQKKPSYEGSAGHSGEYDGSLVEREAQRIKGLLGQ